MRELHSEILSSTLKEISEFFSQEIQVKRAKF
jgi:hypothetical protein